MKEQFVKRMSWESQELTFYTPPSASEVCEVLFIDRFWLNYQYYLLQCYMWGTNAYNYSILN